MHVAIIMDGNRRWARAHGLPVAEGYRRGVAALRAAVRAAVRAGVTRLTVYGFSTENWRRESGEVDLLMQLFAACARGERDDLVRSGVRVEIVGDVDAFTFPARAALRGLEKATRDNARLTLALALNYSGRAEIVRAVRAIARDVASGTLDANDVDDDALRARFFAPHAPDPDLLVRTGAEHRISNFLLYQLAYAELVALPIMWPEFTEDHFLAALETYARRERRYGA